MLSFSLQDSSKGSLNVSYESPSYILHYPCSDVSDCTPYQSLLPRGAYILETWGAQGGLNGGKGGYSRAMLTLHSPTLAYFFIGAEGTSELKNNEVIPKSYNGGGQGSTAKTDPSRKAGSGGGGTDIRLLNYSLFNRIIVAGGGGGATKASGYNPTPGDGGGLNGFDAPSGAKGGTQESSPRSTSCKQGSFGEGGSNDVTGNVVYTTGGGGGGWFGGSTGKLGAAGGGAGGSGYILHAHSYIPKGYFSGYQNYFLQLYTILDGQSNFTKCVGAYSADLEQELGHSGSGCIRITKYANVGCASIYRTKYFSPILVYIIILAK